MWSIIAASVVVLPEPVGPVTSTSPRFSSARRRTTGGRPSSSIGGMPGRMWRSTIADRAALTEHVHPEPADAAQRVGEVGLVRGDELLGADLGHDREGDALGVGGLDLLVRDRHQLSVETDVRRRAHLDVDVGRAAFHGLSQHLVEIEHRDVLPRLGRRRRSAGPSRVSASRRGPCRDVWPNRARIARSRRDQPVRRCCQSSPTAVDHPVAGAAARGRLALGDRRVAAGEHRDARGRHRVPQAGERVAALQEGDDPAPGHGADETGGEGGVVGRA